jgi:hypothetical protein
MEAATKHRAIERERESGVPSAKRSKESEESKVRGVEFMADAKLCQK